MHCTIIWVDIGRLWAPRHPLGKQCPYMLCRQQTVSHLLLLVEVIHERPGCSQCVNKHK